LLFKTANYGRSEHNIANRTKANNQNLFHVIKLPQMNDKLQKSSVNEA
jgi:hypothetical protein